MLSFAKLIYFAHESASTLHIKHLSCFLKTRDIFLFVNAHTHVSVVPKKRFRSKGVASSEFIERISLGDGLDVIDLGRNKARSLINGDVELTSHPTGWCNAGELAGPFIYH